jgi:hypothetical protein
MMSTDTRSAFAPNIDLKGRAFRGAGAITSAAIALFLLRRSIAAGVVLGATSLFLGFEAFRGWCALRACGLKTKF